MDELKLKDLKEESLETTAVLVCFVAALVEEVGEMMGSARRIAHVTGRGVSDECYEALNTVGELLEIENKDDIIKASAEAHRTVTVQEGGPYDHYMDMLSSCVSALRFGLVTPCSSRHAAAAADHIWKQKYGITLFDKHSNGWGKRWAKSKFYESFGKLIKKESVQQ